MLSKEIYLIRHGETDANRNGTIQGRGLNPPLNDHGLQQAQRFFSLYGSVPFEAVYTSSLLRTQQSVAGFIAKGIPWIATADLDEISWGLFEGKPATEQFHQAYRKLIQAWRQGHLDACAPQGESPLMVQKRMHRFRRQLIDSAYRLILVCTHGRALRILLSELLQTPLEEMEQYAHYNFILYILRYENQRFYLRTCTNSVPISS
ncbi:MAG: histidine phosphatase family protein [Chitinophagales bacterium]|nr:histidine phosphatase family protein [Chitinophagales bacterium]MDW8427661.1 histidine phosphatase family protein [Chitinophagales bacterium]